MEGNWKIAEKENVRKKQEFDGKPHFHLAYHLAAQGKAKLKKWL